VIAFGALKARLGLLITFRRSITSKNALIEAANRNQEALHRRCDRGSKGRELPCNRSITELSVRALILTHYAKFQAGTD